MQHADVILTKYTANFLLQLVLRLTLFSCSDIHRGLRYPCTGIRTGAGGVNMPSAFL